MEFKQRSLMQLAKLICGNFEGDKSFFRYRSSTYLTEFFQDCDTDCWRRRWIEPFPGLVPTTV